MHRAFISCGNSVRRKDYFSNIVCFLFSSKARSFRLCSVKEGRVFGFESYFFWRRERVCDFLHLNALMSILMHMSLIPPERLHLIYNQRQDDRPGLRPPQAGKDPNYD